MQLQCGRNKEVGWKGRQKYISLAISSDPQAGTGYSTICLLALVQTRIQKSSLFLTPDMSIWQEENPSQFCSLQRHKLAWITNWKHSSQLKVYFLAVGVAENRETGMQLGEVKVKSAFCLPLKPTMQILIHETQRNLGSSFSPVWKHTHLKRELPTEPKLENMLMSEFCPIYKPSAKSSQLPAYHKPFLPSPSLHPLLWNSYNFQYRMPMHK